MKFRRITLLLLAALSFGFWSCDDDDDNSITDLNAPTIDVSLEQTTVAAGGELHVDVDITDDNQITQLSIDIHDAFDGHTHERVTLSAFEYAETIEVNQRNFENHFDIEVAADAIAGAYHFDAFALDAAGNQSEYISLDFVVTNGTQAAIAVTNPANFGSGEIEVSPTDSLALNFTVTDDVGIHEIIIAVESEEEDHDHDHGGRVTDGGGELAHYEEGEDFEEGATSVPIEGAYDLTSLNLEAGEHYELEITVRDEEGNYTIMHTELHVE